MHIKKLDAIRGFAAMYVAIGHWTHNNPRIPEIVQQIFRFGQQSVILFFLLSGFVIFIASQKKDLGFKDYFIKRFRRIYPIMLLAFVLSVVIALVDGQFVKRFEWSSFLGNLFMLQDYSTDKPGNWFYYFMGNSPLWSLSYEWWFYMLFYPFNKFVAKQNRTYLAFALSFLSMVSYLIFPNHASLVLGYFFIWYSGFLAAEIYFRENNFNLKNMIGIFAGNFLIFSLVAGYHLLKFKLQSLVGIEAIIVNKLLIHYGTTLLFLGLGLVWWKMKLVGFEPLLKWFYSLAPISYAVYVFHFPILVQWDLLRYFEDENSTVNFIIISIIRFSILIAFSYLAEIKLQPIFNKYLKTGNK